MVRWDIVQVCRNRYTTERHNGVAFTDADGDRKDISGCEVGFACPVIQIRGDWPAICEFFAVRTWSHNTHPCFFCRASKEQLTDPQTLHNISLLGGPWALFGKMDHEAEVQHCTQAVTIACEADRRRIYQTLTYNSRGLGQVLSADIVVGGARLLTGDRLEPSSQFMDVSKLVSSPLPLHLQFWRCGPADRVTHASPLLGIPGVSLDLVGVDLLHCWHLGCLQPFIGACLWLLLQSRVLLGVRGGRDEGYKSGLIQLKSEMFRYYADRRATDADFRARGSQVAGGFLWAPCSHMLNGSDTPGRRAKKKHIESEGHNFLWVYRVRGGGGGGRGGCGGGVRRGKGERERCGT